METTTLRALLDERAMHQVDLAERLRIPKQTLHNYITGRRRVPLALAIRIAQLFGRPVESIQFSDRPVSELGSKIS